MEFGESREYLPHLDLHLRIGFAGTIYAEFAVNHRTGSSLFGTSIGADRDSSRVHLGSPWISPRLPRL